jgi:7-cyano-7-deazaguanine synthase in queuosine biosynthesis
MKSCILFSGGWDSVAVAILEKASDLLFINYGQIYYEKELTAAKTFSIENNRKLIIHNLPLRHDIERRNFYLILEAKKLGYSKVYTGNRNILPIFDKYRDSNWLTLKILGLISNLRIKMPIVGWSKKKIIKLVQSKCKTLPYNCYLNGSDYRACICVNCKELQQILK